MINIKKFCKTTFENTTFISDKKYSVLFSDRRKNRYVKGEVC